MSVTVRQIPSAGFTQGTWLDRQSCALGRMANLVRQGNPSIEIMVHDEEGKPVWIGSTTRTWKIVKVHYVSLDNVLCITVDSVA